MFIKLYKKLLPPKIRKIIWKVFVVWLVRPVCETIKVKLVYCFQKFLSDTETNRSYVFMGKHGVTPFPYPFVLEYRNMLVDCQFDEQLAMYYVLHKGKRLYFPQQFSKKKIIKSYRWLMAEQDIHSPHRYIADINQLRGKTLLDCGAAEGILTLDFIDMIKQAYLFECSEKWIKALNATFAPYEDKITIIDKYVGDTNDGNNITIDKFLEDKDKNNLFLKMDIEGFEQAALQGASKTLENSKDLDFAICTYHKKNDAVEIASILTSYEFDCEYTQGYFYVNWDEGNNGFRKAIIRRKQNYQRG